MKTFEELGLSPELLKSIKENFETPTEIQEKAIPIVLSGRDVIAGSATGSGKTLAFGSKIIHDSENIGKIQALILTPTRELAEQITKNMIKFSKYKPLKIISVYGGVSINEQVRELRTADIVVGTPGRILDHIRNMHIDFSHVRTLVLDEADRMLDMGFIEDVSKIIERCPENRQTLLFSATISPDIEEIASKFMKDYEEVSAEKYVDPSKLSQVYYDVQDNMKFSLLVHLLKSEKGIIMVFCNTRKNTDFLANNLRFNDIDSLAIHGGFSQEKRNKIMKNFHSQETHVLICTDVVARGIDIPGVSHIYNYDAPKDAKDYVHRIGRTARAGKSGKVINLICTRDYDNFRRISANPELTITEEKLPEITQAEVRWLPSRRFSGNSRSRFGSRDRSDSRSRFGSRSSYGSRDRSDSRPSYGSRSRFQSRDRSDSRDSSSSQDSRRSTHNFRRGVYSRSSSGSRDNSSSRRNSRDSRPRRFSGNSRRFGRSSFSRRSRY